MTLRANRFFVNRPYELLTGSARLAMFASLDTGETQMRKNLGGGSKIIKARLRAYAEAVAAGATSQEAYEAARKISLKSLRKAGR